MQAGWGCHFKEPGSVLIVTVVCGKCIICGRTELHKTHLSKEKTMRTENSFQNLSFTSGSKTQNLRHLWGFKHASEGSSHLFEKTAVIMIA